MLPITSERISKLREFGLSEYAARTYLALLDLGVTEARDVSALSKVPASKIYHILDQLHEKGLVTILPEFPRKYAPVPFAEFVDKIHDEHESAARTIRDDREGLLEMFALSGGVAGADRGSLTLVRGRRNVVERVAELLASAREDVLLLATPGMAAKARGWAPPLEQAQARGVHVRLLGLAESLDLPAHEHRLRAEGLGSSARALLLLVDGTRALVAHFVPDDGHAYDGSDTGLATDQEGVVSLLTTLAEGAWGAAPPLRGVGVPVRSAPELPARD